MSATQFRACIFFAVISFFPSVSAADVVTEWNQKAEAAALEAKIYRFAGTRVMAIVHAAMFDAINSIEGRYAPYKFKVDAPPGSSPEAAGVAAAHAALVQLVLIELKLQVRKAWMKSTGRRFVASLVAFFLGACRGREAVQTVLVPMHA